MTEHDDPIAESIRLLRNAGWTKTEAKNLLRGVRASSPDELAKILPAWVEHCVEKMAYVNAILKPVAIGVVLVQRIDGEWVMQLRTDDE